MARRRGSQDAVAIASLDSVLEESYGAWCYGCYQDSGMLAQAAIPSSLGRIMQVESSCTPGLRPTLREESFSIFLP